MAIAVAANSASATAEEVEQAIRKLTAADYARLRKAARIKVVGSGYATADELLNDALATPYLAALGQGGRRWPKGVDFVAFTINTIRGLASDSRGSVAVRLTRSSRKLRHSGKEYDVLESSHYGTPSIEQLIIGEQDDDDRERDADTLLKQVYVYFKEDVEVLAIIEGKASGLSASKIQTVTGMSKTQYESAWRRVRRGIEKIVPGRRKS